jgi:hypothetical protein
MFYCTVNRKVCSGKGVFSLEFFVALAPYLLRLQQNSSDHLLVLGVALDPDIAYS